AGEPDPAVGVGGARAQAERPAPVVGVGAAVGLATVGKRRFDEAARQIGAALAAGHAQLLTRRARPGAEAHRERARARLAVAAQAGESVDEIAVGVAVTGRADAAGVDDDLAAGHGGAA